LAGFVLIPAIGAHASLKLGIVTNLLVAVLLVAAVPSLPLLWRWGSLAATFLVIANVWLILPWDLRVMSSGPAIYAKKYLQEAARSSLADVLKGRRLLFYRDGISSTVSVSQEGPAISLHVNGKTDASTARDMPTQLMSGHLPLLIHPHPQTVLVIGLGSGITAGAVARHAIEHVDVAEIEPAVVEASRFFAQEHGDVLKNPRVRTVIADGRNFLLTTSTLYDVIISEPSNPWIGGLASLFSVEFYRLVRERLHPGGIMLQWVQAYNIHAEDLQMVVKTFRTVFPDTTIWGTVKGDFLLLGRAEKAPLDLHVIKARFKMSTEVGRDLYRLGIDAWPGVLGYFMLGEEDTARFSADAGLNTDDRLPLEFSAPRALYVDTTDRNWALVRSFKKAELPSLTPASLDELEQPQVRYWIGMGYLGRLEWEEALAHFQRALQLDPRHTSSMLGAGLAHIRLGRPAVALGLARKALNAEPRNVQAFYLAGRASEALKAPADAVLFFEKAVALQPNDSTFLQALKRAQEGKRMQ
jgi:spermidine synthase